MQDTESSTDISPREEAKIHSLYIKPSSWERLGIVKRYLNLSYTETIDLLVGHIIQEEILPKEASEELKKCGLFREEDKIGLEINGIYGRWPESAKKLDQLSGVLEELNIKLELLVECIDDHAEAMVLKETL
jgi:hypothetical protein